MSWHLRLVHNKVFACVKTPKIGIGRSAQSSNRGEGEGHLSKNIGIIKDAIRSMIQIE